MANLYNPFVSGSKTFVPSGESMYRNQASTLNSPQDTIAVRPGKTTRSGVLQCAVVRTQHFVNAEGLKVGALEVERTYRLIGKVPDGALTLKTLDGELSDFATQQAINGMMLGDS